MKRSGEDSFANLSKRRHIQDLSSAQHQGEARTPSHGNDASTLDSQGGNTGLSPFYQNPLTQLEAALTTFATESDKTHSLFGEEIQTQMRSLLALITRYQRALSPNKLLPSVSPPPKLNLHPVGLLRGFDQNPTPSRQYLLPDLPEIRDGPYKEVPFYHASMAKVDPITGLPASDSKLSPVTRDAGHIKNSTSWQSPGLELNLPAPVEVNYERLEFLGDSYLHTIASNIIFLRFPLFTAGKATALRTVMVTNETLYCFAKAYKFDKRILVDGLYRDAPWQPKNKGFNKICADVFEAYLAALILSDQENGMQIAEKWLWQLWTPLLIKAQDTKTHQIGSVYDEKTFVVPSGLRDKPNEELLIQKSGPVATRDKDMSPTKPSSTASTPEREARTTGQAANGKTHSPGASNRSSPSPSRVDRKSPPVADQKELSILDQAVASIKRLVNGSPPAIIPYHPEARATLQKRIAPHDVILSYRDTTPTPPTSSSSGLRKHHSSRGVGGSSNGGSNLAMSSMFGTADKFRLSVYLNGWGYKDHLLGSGEGETKVEASNRAAMDAMFQNRKLVEECEQKFETRKATEKRMRKKNKKAKRSGNG